MFILKLPKPILYGSAAAALFGFACITKESLGGPSYNREIQAQGKVIIVTGANTGIGKETACELAKRGAKVYMACRDMRRCEKAREEIVLETKNKYVYCRKCDLSSLESIKEFANTFLKEQNRLDVLINNAGVMRTPNSKTRDGFEMQLGVNHLGHFYLTNLLLDRLKASVPSRIINVSSVAHKRGEIDKTDLNSSVKYDAGKAYAQSKLANLLFTRELSRKLDGSGVTVNAIHPGIVDTEIIRHMGFFNSWLATIFIKPLVWPFIKGPRQGAQTTIFAALDPKLEKITGKYFVDCKETETSPAAQDDSTASWLW
ncbi:dehydrogenase, partial [Oryctes borbonicus]